MKIIKIGIGFAALLFCAQGNSSTATSDLFDIDLLQEDDIPVVLSATRLKQPSSEVPASMTVITDEHIKALGVRTLQEVLRFVPGMIYGHSHQENNTVVAYHISSPNLFRRIQVLVDGRSVYKSAIASVVWDDIPVALEDIQRVEVTRGPNSAAYGANAFMAVINIITKGARDTTGTRLRYRMGNKGTSDAFISQSGLVGEGAYRVSANIAAHDGFDDEYTQSRQDKIQWYDSKQHGFINGLYQQDLNEWLHWDIQAAWKDGYSELRSTEYPTQYNEHAVIHSKLQMDFSERHHSYFQIYVSQDRREHEGRLCSLQVLGHPDLYKLYERNPYIVRDVISAYDGAAQGQELAAVQNVLNRPEYAQDAADILALLTAPNMLDTEVCGTSDMNLSERRLDMEWQDTVIWNDRLRTVSGINYRYDYVDSEHYFSGSNTNELIRLFANAEWRMTPWLIVNAGGTYEYEEKNDAFFTPRIAFNWLVGEQQSIRLVHSKAVRSPDLLEQEGRHRVHIENLTPNNLGQNGTSVDHTYYYAHRRADRELDHERITSTELGYYGHFPRMGLEVDAKVYRDRLTHMISGAINTETIDIKSDNRIDVDGAEIQIQWQYDRGNWLWLNWAHIDADFYLGDTSHMLLSNSNDMNNVERRVSAKNTYMASWHHQQNRWASTLSYVWYDDYNYNKVDYRRVEWYVRKDFTLGKTNPWLGVWWQHLLSDDHLSYDYQRYNSDNIYFIQVGLDF